MLWPTPPKRGFFVRVPHASRGVFRQTCSVRVKRPVLTSRLAFLLGYATAARGVSDPSRAVFLPVSVPGSPNYRFEQKKFFRKLEKKFFFSKIFQVQKPRARRRQSSKATGTLITLADVKLSTRNFQERFFTSSKIFG